MTNVALVEEKVQIMDTEEKVAAKMENVVAAPTPVVEPEPEPEPEPKPEPDLSEGGTKEEVKPGLWLTPEERDELSVFLPGYRSIQTERLIKIIPALMAKKAEKATRPSVSDRPSRRPSKASRRANRRSSNNSVAVPVNLQHPEIRR